MGAKNAARDVISASPHAGAWRMLRGQARSAWTSRPSRSAWTSWPSRATRTARSGRPTRTARSGRPTRTAGRTRYARPARSSRCNASNKTEEIVVSEFTSTTSSFQVNEVSLPEPELRLRSGAALQRAHRRGSDDVARGRAALTQGLWRDFQRLPTPLRVAGSLWRRGAIWSRARES